jgi:hypothetical protein
MIWIFLSCRYVLLGINIIILLVALIATGNSVKNMGSNSKARQAEARMVRRHMLLPPSQLSVFKKTPIQNILNFMYHYKMTTRFQVLNRGKNLVMHSGTNGKHFK